MLSRTTYAALSASRRRCQGRIGPLASSVSVVKASSSAFYSTSHVSENDPQTLEEEKMRNLSNSQTTIHDHAPGWNELLASNSEANVKADKATGTTLDFQRQSIEYVKQRHADGKEATKSESGTEDRKGTDDKDEVSGPLKDAQPDESRETIKGPLSTSQGKEVNEGNTASEDAVKADRGEH